MRPPDDLLPRLAKLSLGAAQRAGSLAVSLARHVADRLPGRGEGCEARSEERVAPVAAEPAPPPPKAAPAATAAPRRPRRPPRTRPDHVDREAVVVAASADAGAQGGPGPQIHIDEPWDGYGGLSAKQVIAELSEASPAALAVARLYESAHRDRRTVIAAIDRRLAAADG